MGEREIRPCKTPDGIMHKQYDILLPCSSLPRSAARRFAGFPRVSAAVSAALIPGTQQQYAGLDHIISYMTSTPDWGKDA